MNGFGAQMLQSEQSLCICWHAQHTIVVEIDFKWSCMNHSLIVARRHHNFAFRLFANSDSAYLMKMKCFIRNREKTKSCASPCYLQIGFWWSFQCILDAITRFQWCFLVNHNAERIILRNWLFVIDLLIVVVVVNAHINIIKSYLNSCQT